jgi:hypothetical protein
MVLGRQTVMTCLMLLCELLNFTLGQVLLDRPEHLIFLHFQLDRDGLAVLFFDEVLIVVEIVKVWHLDVFVDVSLIYVIL